MRRNVMFAVIILNFQNLERLIPNIWNRLRLIKCEKCIKIDLMDKWCGQSDTCYAVDPIKKLSYFIDWHHPSSYGAMFMGNWVFEAYKNEF
jgi:hypothetical protein